MGSPRPYADKLADHLPQTLVPLLDPTEQSAVAAIATRYQLSFSELRQLGEAARDLQMWREASLSSWWESSEAELGATLQGRERKKRLLGALSDHLGALRRAAKQYPSGADRLRSSPPAALRVEKRTNPEKHIFGLCPAYSDETVCCGLHTLDAVTGCSFGCSYCTIQTFYGETAALDAQLAEKLARMPLEKERFYHIGTGQASDSLVWGNRGGGLDALCDFARSHPNILLELKTKSDRVGYFLENPAPPNLAISWTLNPQQIISNEEHRTASLERRLDAAQRVADAGIKVAFHFHPMVYYDGWDQGYGEVAEMLLHRFTPQQVLFITMGSVTLIRPVVQEIRRRGGETKILQMNLTPDHHGKLTYPDSVKVELFGGLYRRLESWHREVFFYLCMEQRHIWEQAWGWCYENNNFEGAFAEHIRRQCGID